MLPDVHPSTIKAIFSGIALMISCSTFLVRRCIYFCKVFFEIASSLTFFFTYSLSTKLKGRSSMHIHSIQSWMVWDFLHCIKSKVFWGPDGVVSCCVRICTIKLDQPVPFFCFKILPHLHLKMSFSIGVKYFLHMVLKSLFELISNLKKSFQFENQWNQ